MKVINKILLACVAIGIAGVAQAKPVLLLKVHGMYCNTCLTGVKDKIEALGGVKVVHLFFKEHMVAVYPKKNIHKMYKKTDGFSDIMHIINKKSGYNVKGAWTCERPTVKPWDAKGICKKA